jgi:hypothetical protein
MKTQKLLLTVMAALLVFSGAALAAGPDGAGSGGGGSGGGGSGGGGDTEPPDYGDLVILYRNADGVPILTNADGDTGLCEQPIAFPSDTCPVVCVEGEPCLVPVNPITCAIEVGYETCTQEVDFGRINSARSPPSVFESQLADVVVKLATADCITLDPAGRLVASTVEGGVVSTSTIDSPLQNMAIYNQIMSVGFLGAESSPIALPASPLNTAARGVGVASDKSGFVHVDLIVYLNQIMGLSDLEETTLGPPLCQFNREEVQGVVQEVEKCFLNYGAYGYDRGLNFGALPRPAYIPGDNPSDGTFEYLKFVAGTEDDPRFYIEQGPIMAGVFLDDPGYINIYMNGNMGGDMNSSNISRFAQTADDTRAVINFMHDWPMPDADIFATPLVCEASGDIGYDVSISAVSGLQVPENIVDGSSDREFIVNVANAGPDDATVTLTVTAIPDVGGTVLANLDGDDPDAGFITSPFVFPPTEITAGGSHSFSALIFVDIGQQTTINWTAVAAAPDDVFLGNNTATAVSNVRVTGSVITPEIVTPNGGESLAGMSTVNILWTSHPDAATYWVRFSSDGGTSWSRLATQDAALPTNYSWSIPNNINSANCLINVIAFNGVGQWLATDTSDGVFTVAPVP